MAFGRCKIIYFTRPHIKILGVRFGFNVILVGDKNYFYYVSNMKRLTVVMPVVCNKLNFYSQDLNFKILALFKML